MNYWAARGGMKMAFDLKQMNRTKVIKRMVEVPQRNEETGKIESFTKKTIVDICQIPKREIHRMSMRMPKPCI